MFVWFPWHNVIYWEASREFETTRVEKNQTDSPRVNLKRFRVAIMGEPTVPKHGKEQGSLRIGVPCLVTLGTFAIKSKLNLESY